MNALTKNKTLSVFIKPTTEERLNLSVKLHGQNGGCQCHIVSSV